MLFEEHFLVETDHTVTNKSIQMLPIAKGIITWVSVKMPEGCHGLVSCAIYHHEHPIFPSTEGMSIVGDDEPVEWTEYYEAYQPPFELKVKLWGVSLTYDHIVTVRVVVLPRKAVVALSVADAIKGLFGLLAPRRIKVGG